MAAATAPNRIAPVKIGSLMSQMQYCLVRLRLEKQSIYRTEEMFYLRTGRNRSELVEEADDEFSGYGYTRDRFNSCFDSGLIRLDDIDFSLVPFESRDLRFLISLALAKYGLEEKLDGRQPFCVERTPTKLWYNSGMVITRATGYKNGLEKFLTSADESYTVSLLGPRTDEVDWCGMERGILPSSPAIMNFGKMYRRLCSVFQHPERDESYVLPNEGSDTANLEERFGLGTGSQFEVGKVSRCKQVDMGESAQVESDHRYFFDGSLQDVFGILEMAGIRIDRDIVL